MAKMTRAIYSQRQLQQVMGDFWFNHFNVFAGKGEDRYFLTSYERDVIQPHALGKFKDLVTATAKSPAMLFYLDNFLSADPRAAQRLAQERAMVVAPTTAVPMSTGFAVALKVLPAPSLASSISLAFSKLTSMLKSFFSSALMLGTFSMSESS